jgi:hypothetical protein
MTSFVERDLETVSGFISTYHELLDAKLALQWLTRSHQ